MNHYKITSLGNKKAVKAFCHTMALFFHSFFILFKCKIEI